MTQPEPLLEIAGLRTEIRLRDSVIRAVDGVSLSIGAGECLGLVGESGCGKTMTALSVLRLLPPGAQITGGRIALRGRDLCQLTARTMQEVRGNEIGMVFQDPASSLNPTMTIGSQVAESVLLHRGAGRRGARERMARERAAEMLQLVRMPEPERVAAGYPHELSGGMRQRAMIAMALACEPGLLIADEPTTALDVTTQRQILELIDELRHRLGMAVLLVSHDLGVIGGHADRIAVMYAGRIVESAATSAVFAGPRHPYTEALFDALPGRAIAGGRPLYSIPGTAPDLASAADGCRFAPRCRRAQDCCSRNVPELDGDHPGHACACFFPAGPAAPGGAAWLSGQDAAGPGARARLSKDAGPGGQAGPAHRGRGESTAAPDEPLLRLTDLVKSYPVTGGLLGGRQVGAVSAVTGVSFEINAGQTFGLVGESGCGKTTIAKLIVGLERPSSGSVLFRGTDLSRLGGRQLRSYRPAVQLMFQDSDASLDPRMRAGSILREPLVIQQASRRAGHRRMVARILTEVGLPADSVRRYPREFSGGQRQRLALARALILRPQLIIADEPISSLDVSVAAQILNLMRKLQRQHGLAYLFISHDLSVIRYMADVVGVMYLGKLVETGPAATIWAAPAHPYTRGLISAAPVSAGMPQPAAGTPQPADGTPLPADGVPQPADGVPQPGCRFRARCGAAREICAVAEPPLRPAAAGQLVACHFPMHDGRPAVTLPAGQG